MRLAGKTALVVGASRGLGREIAKALAREGVEVVATSRRPQEVDWPSGLQPFSFDLLPVSTIADQWQSHGWRRQRFDIVVNNAGAGVFGDFSATEFSSWEDQIDLLLKAPLLVGHLAWPGLRQAGGTLVNVTSLACEFPVPFMSAYNAGKAGLAAFTTTMAIEQGEVRVIDFRPGDLDTTFNDSMQLGQPPAERPESFERAWKTMDERAGRMPSAESAARVLVRALARGRRGVVRCGSRFQRGVAPFLARISFASWQRACIRAYYKLGEK